MTKTAAPTIVELPVALHIPVSVLAQMPEKLRVLAQAVKTCSKVVGGSCDAFREAHKPVREAYSDANGTANCIVNAFNELVALNGDQVKVVVTAAKSAKQLTSAIYNVCGNIHNDDCFKTTFHDKATVDATVTALNACGDEIRAALRQFGY
jgi:hypothetical protein